MNYDWLNTKKKSELNKLAKLAGLTVDGRAPKQIIISTLAEHLESNKSECLKIAAFQEYYDIAEAWSEPLYQTVGGYKGFLITLQTLVLLYEIAVLLQNTWPTATTPLPVTASQCARHHYPQMPDSWKTVVKNWLAPAALWSLTSLVFPLVISYFFNFTLRSNVNRKFSDHLNTADPLTFSIAKAFVALGVMALSATDMTGAGELSTSTNQAVDTSWGLFCGHIVGAVHKNIYRGYWSPHIGAFVGILVSLYGAVPEK